MKEWVATFLYVLLLRKGPIYRYNMVTHKGYKSNNY